ncbi:ABC transporter ATP-binding protein, partial [Mycobacterium tuberculosis]|nr:ABC transporter ATP-binding protein [Mycobacterium tuberculosis]
MGFSYGNDVPVLHGISFTAEAGKTTAIIGASGAGKSTLIGLIQRFYDIDSGRILIDGQDVSGMSPKDRDIAMVFQSYALYPTMSVRENIEFGLKIRKLPQAAIDEEVARVAKLLQIEHLLARKPAQLSGGQQQRVAMG